jgi:hypothetical protein
MANAQNENAYQVSDPIYFSQDFLYAVKTEGNTEFYIDTLARFNLIKLSNDLNSQSKKLAFWLNIYNALAQYYLQANVALYNKSKNKFFSGKYITIGREKVSLDLIENGILRNSKFKYGLGYIGKLFPSAFERKFRVDTVDARIHFCLNCGATSCPTIAFYKPEEISEQLNTAAIVYLQAEVIHDKEKNIIYLPTILSWFKGDFGGKKGILQMLEKYSIIARDTNPKIKFKKYDWTLDAKKFTTE